MAPSASAASCRTIGFSAGSSSTRLGGVEWRRNGGYVGVWVGMVLKSGEALLQTGPQNGAKPCGSSRRATGAAGSIGAPYMHSFPSRSLPARRAVAAGSHTLPASPRLT